MSHRIKCRAALTKNCLDGKPTVFMFGDDLPMSEDGTFIYSNLTGEHEADSDDGTVICDDCYLKLCPLTPSGRGLLIELPAAMVKWAEGHGKENGK